MTKLLNPACHLMIELSSDRGLHLLEIALSDSFGPEVDCSALTQGLQSLFTEQKLQVVKMTVRQRVPIEL